jgi:proline iminopeptidase
MTDGPRAHEGTILVGDNGEPAPLFTVEVSDGRAASPAAEVAIMLHGGPGASHDYLRPQLDGLSAPERRLLYYDQRGSGRSQVPRHWPPAGITEHLADLDTVIDAAQTSSGKKPSLVGFSWGGLLALHYALASPKKISRLLLLAPAPSYAAGREEMRKRMRAAAERPDVRAFVQGLDRSDRRQRFAGAIAGYFYDPRRALEVTPFLVQERAERAVWDSLAGYDLRARLPSLSVPTRILHGVEDPVPIETARETARLSGAELIELPHCGHVCYVEAHDETIARGREHLNGA